jgi:hypothetical protein
MSAKFDVDFKYFVENTNADETEIGENGKDTTLKNDSDIREWEKERARRKSSKDCFFVKMMETDCLMGK